MTRSLLLLAALAGSLAAATACGAPAGDVWVLIDTDTGTAEIRRQDEIILTLPDLSFGRGGTSDLHIEGDDTTPRGDYRVTRIKRDSRFHVFVGLDYPTLDHLDKANRRGLIGEAQYAFLLKQGARRGRLPPDTILGGHIGLHGVGLGDVDIHRRLNWTEGCVAMTDEQIDELLRFVRRGTRVVIR